MRASVIPNDSAASRLIESCGSVDVLVQSLLQGALRHGPDDLQLHNTGLSARTHSQDHDQTIGLGSDIWKEDVCHMLTTVGRPSEANANSQ